ncbi:MAG: hypothetical protein ACFE7R_00740, partial [Candidatus Hodarchaeota archaeon]
ESLDYIRKTIHSLKIIDAVRARLQHNWNGSTTSVSFDKQAAYNKKLRILDDREEEPPLGCINLVIAFAEPKDFEKFLIWFTPKTIDGRVVEH